MKLVTKHYGYELRQTEKCGWGYVIYHAHGPMTGVHAENLGSVGGALIAARKACEELEARYEAANALPPL